MAIGGAWIKAICVIICAAQCAHVGNRGIIMHLDDRWLSGGGRHVSKADPWLDDGLGTIAPMFCPPLSIQICKIRHTNTNTNTG